MHLSLSPCSGLLLLLLWPAAAAAASPGCISSQVPLAHVARMVSLDFLDEWERRGSKVAKAEGGQMELVAKRVKVGLMAILDQQDYR